MKNQSFRFRCKLLQHAITVVMVLDKDMVTAQVIYCQILSKRMQYDAERDLSAIAKFMFW